MFKHSRHKYVNFARIYRKMCELYEGLPSVERRRKKHLSRQFFKYGLIAAAVLLLLSIGLGLAQAFNFKSVYDRVSSGRTHIENSLAAVKLRSFEQAAGDARQAGHEFDQAADLLAEVNANFLFKTIPQLKRQVEDFLFLVESAGLLSAGLSEASEIAADFQNLISSEASFSELSANEKGAVLGLLHQKSPELAGIRSNLDLAMIKLDQVSWKGLLYPFKNRFGSFENRLKEAQSILDVAVPMSQILPEIMGYPEASHFLFILQNQDELRPTGGFIGTYGIVKTYSGEIERFDTHDIYHMDMPVKDLVNVVPPRPLQDYLGVQKWYMRDANWSPHWPQAAEKILEFYRLENAKLPPKDQINDYDGDFNAVIAVTPDLVVDLLRLVGPVELEGETFTPDNFTRLLQYKVEKGYVQLGIPSWHRKEVIGDIAAVIKERLLDRKLQDLGPVIDRIGENLMQKNILIYAREPVIQEVVKDNNWWGGIGDAEKDYLYVVDANMAALKTDAVMDRKIDYILKRTQSGLVANAAVHYLHNGEFDWRTTRYRSYTRVYVPAGAELISFKGQSEGEVEVGHEYGKTVFSAFISVEPGQKRTLNLQYRLPENLATAIVNGEYELLLQHQPGRPVEDINIDLDFAAEVMSYQPVSFFAEQVNPGQVVWQNELTHDTLYRVQFK